MNLLEVYEILYDHFGPQNWWPGESDFEMIIGAILTQQTSWSNVEKAIENLKKKNLLEPKKIHDVEIEKLQKLILPSGYYRQKSKKLKNFVNFLLEKHDGKIENFFEQSLKQLREDLLSVNGIGKETADSIILYAAKKSIFVIDAYTIRIFNRLGIIKEKDYEKMRILFEKNLRNDTRLFNEYHALIVKLGKDYCKVKPVCKKCPLNLRCEYAINFDNSTKGKD